VERMKRRYLSIGMDGGRCMWYIRCGSNKWGLRVQLRTSDGTTSEVTSCLISLSSAVKHFSLLFLVIVLKENEESSSYVF
jgi:hypothetical protein